MSGLLVIDTNIVVRFLMGDTAEQAVRARRLVELNDTLLLTTVLLESEWVLRSVFGKSRTAIAKALGDFIAMPKVTIEEPARATKALALFGQGLDFADAIHLAAAHGHEAFVTFDRALARSGLGDMPVREP